MTAVGWLLGLTGLVIFGLAAVGNAWILSRQLRSSPGDSSPSFAPLVGGLAGSLGLLLIPVGTVPDRIAYIWVPLVADLGCLPFLLLAMVAVLTNRRPRS